MFCTNPQCPDLQETGTPGEYVDGLESCPMCGATLVAELPEPADGYLETLTAEHVEPVFETWEPSEAEVVRTILNGAGIPFLIEGHDQLAAYRAGHAGFRFHPLGGAIQFVVPRDRAEEAWALLTEMESEDDDPDSGDSPPPLQLITS